MFTALAAGVLATTGVTAVAADGERAALANPTVASHVMYAQPVLAAVASPSPAPSALLGARFNAGAPQAAAEGSATDPGGTLISITPTAHGSAASSGASSRSSATAFTPEVVAGVVAHAGGGAPDTAVTVLVASPTGALQVATTTIADLPGALAGLLGDIGGQIP